MMKSRSLALSAAAALLLACGGDADVDPGSTPAIAADAPATSQPANPSANVDETADVRLTRDRFERWVATLEELNRIAHTSPQVADAIGTNSEESLEEAVARMEAHPEVTTALGRHGFTAASYVGFMSNMIYAMGAHSAREAGQQLPGTYPVNEDDVRFIAENQDWVKQQWQRVENLQ